MSREDAFRGQVVQAFMISPRVVVVDEVCELPLKVARKIIVFKQDAVFHRAMPALDLTLRLRMIGLAACVRDLALLEPSLQLCRDVARAVVAEEPRPVPDTDVLQSRRIKRVLQCARNILRTHRPAQPPGDDIAREVVHHRREVVPAPAGDLDVCVYRFRTSWTDSAVLLR